jgi:hypothetical protein
MKYYITNKSSNGYCYYYMIKNHDSSESFIYYYYPSNNKTLIYDFNTDKWSIFNTLIPFNENNIEDFINRFEKLKLLL